MTSALRWGGWSAPHPGRFTPGKDPVLIVQEAGWAPGPVWTGAENLASTGIRSPDRPVSSESLYRLSYPGQLNRPLRSGRIPTVTMACLASAVTIVLMVSMQSCWRNLQLFLSLIFKASIVGCYAYLVDSGYHLLLRLLYLC